MEQLKNLWMEVGLRVRCFCVGYRQFTGRQYIH